MRIFKKLVCLIVILLLFPSLAFGWPVYRDSYIHAGDLIVDPGRILLSNGSAAAPSLSFINDPNTGLYRIGEDNVGIVVGGNLAIDVYTGSIDIAGGILYLGSNVRLNKDDIDILALRRTGANPQTFRIYELFTDVNNYERYALIASGNQLEIQAQTLGSGTDNLSIKLTPAGTGQVLFPDGSTTLPAIAFTSNPGTGIFISGSSIVFTNAGVQSAYYSETILATPSTINLGWYNDIYIIRDGVGVAALRNGANIQTFKLYETYTDAANYERFAFITGANLLNIQGETLGTGSDDLTIRVTPAGVGEFQIGTSICHLLVGGGGYYINSLKVTGERVIDVRIDDVINSGDATTDGVIDAIRDALITHGLVAPL